MMTNQEIIAVVQAAERGDTIESRLVCNVSWVNWSALQGWDFIKRMYRVKPKPKPLEIWVNEHKGSFGAVHLTREAAEKSAGNPGIRCRHFREVQTEDDAMEKKS